METNNLEEILIKDVRYKNLEKRDKIYWKRFNVESKNEKTLLKCIDSMGKQTLALQEINDLIKNNFEIELSLLTDRYNLLKEGISFEPDELDGLPSAAIDAYIARQESAAAEREAAMDKAEATQARIKELLDALVSDQSVPSNEM